MTNPEIAKFLVSVIPQILTVVISVAGIFGKGMIDSSATQLADFAAAGGANRKTTSCIYIANHCFDYPSWVCD